MNGCSNSIKQLLANPAHRPLGHGPGEIVSDESHRDGFARIGASEGFESFALLDIDRIAGDKIDPQIGLNNLPDELMEQIHNSGELGNCSLFDVLDITNSPFGWQIGQSPLTGESTIGSPIDDMFDALLNAFNIRGGYCIPVHSSRSKRGVVIYFGPEMQGDARYPQLSLATVEYFQWCFGQSSAQQSVSDIGLGTTEKTCLASLAEGGTDADLARHLELSEFSVAAFIGSAMKKLGAKTRCQAVAIALARRMI